MTVDLSQHGPDSSGQAPASDTDLFSDEVLPDPYPTYARLRELGPVVWLSRIGFFLLTRYDEVRAALADPATFSSAHGVMMNERMNEASRGVLLCSDGAEHDAMRKVLGAPLTPKALKQLTERIDTEAEALIDRLVFKGRIDAATELAQYLPVTIVSELVGLPSEGRARMLVWAQAVFDCFGPLNARTIAGFPILEEMLRYVMAECVPARLNPEGWAARIWEAAERGDIRREQCPAMMMDYIGPSLDTTIFATQSAIRLLAEHPDQWDLIRDDPSLIPNAINEVVRLESPIQHFSRLVREDTELGGVRLRGGSRVIVSFAAANRDPRKWDNPDDFDVRRRVVNHLGFGFGVHQCAGANLARLEIKALLSALARRVRRIELHEAERCLNNVLRGHIRLDVTLHS